MCDCCDNENDYVPSVDEPYMSKKQLNYFKKKLLDWRSEIEASANVMSYLQEETSPGSDFCDRASVENDARCVLRTKNREHKLLAKIDAALKRIDNGTFGFCEMTGEPIGIKRLLARPIATLSIEAQEQHEHDEALRR